MRARRLLAQPFAVLVLALLAVAGGACRSSSSGDDDGVNPGSDGGIDAVNPDDMKIQAVQDDNTPVGTPVTLRGVVVTAIDKYGNREGNFYVEEPEGGEYSGVLVFGAPLEQVDALSVGDLVDITNAEKDEFSLATDTATITELVGAGGGMMTVNKVGTGTVPAPHVVDALANGRLPEAMRLAEQEKWEHVLITVQNVSVTRDIQPIGGSMPDPTFKDFLITGYYDVDSSLAEIPDALVAKGDCLASITGIGDYFFQYKVLPRSTADIVAGGTDCPAPEADATSCADGIDNDANGFADCNDNSCLAAVQSCTVTTTVANVQTGVVPVNSMVNLSNVVVTGVAFNKKNLWVADNLQAAPNQGVYVFRGSGAAVLPDNIVVGARVNVSGKVQEFDGGDGGDTTTEVSFSNVTFVSAPAGAPTPVTGLTVPNLLVNATGEPYEGVLIELDNVKVSGTESNATAHQRTLTVGTTNFIADDDIYRFTITADTCYASLIGIWHYNAFSDTNSYVFLPRGGAGDITLNGTCN
ncbi:MAG TPA: hypothetical protein VHE35_11430 [Kofleriaceae bacterium]|nr:hypothetical protein [Kofleriaceae bacterium]